MAKMFEGVDAEVTESDSSQLLAETCSNTIGEFSDNWKRPLSDSFDDILRGGDLSENSDFKNLRFENMLSNFRTVSTSFL